MSAESELEDLLAHVTAHTRWLVGASENLVTAAIDTLGGNLGFPKPPTHWDPIGIGGPDGKEHRPEPPLTFPSFPAIDLGTPPATQALDPVALEVGAEFPDLTLPAFHYPKIAGLPAFAVGPPAIDTTVQMPVPPNSGEPFRARWLDFATLPDPALAVTPLPLAPVEVGAPFDAGLFAAARSRFLEDVSGGTGGVPGLDALLADARAWCDGAAAVLYPALRAITDASLAGEATKVLTFLGAARARLDTRLAAARQRALAAAEDRSGWGFPAAAQVALRATAAQVAVARVADARTRADTGTAEQVLAFAEVCGELFDAMNRAVQGIRTQEIEQVLAAHAAAVGTAKGVTGALLAAFEAGQFEVPDLVFAAAEARLAVFEAELLVAMLRFEVADARLEIGGARQDQDGQRVRKYRAEAEAAQADVRRYTAQVAAARAELALKAVPGEVFAAQVHAAEAAGNAHRAMVDARLAEVEGDTARVEAEMAKVKAFEAQARGFEALTTTRSLVAAAQGDRNAAVVAEFEGRAKAALAPLEQSVLENRYALARYEVTADAALEDAKLALKVKRVDLEFAAQKQDGFLKAQNLTRERAQSMVDLELDRLKAIAATDAAGAELLAQMAEGAMSIANGIASAVFKEES